MTENVFRIRDFYLTGNMFRILCKFVILTYRNKHVFHYIYSVQQCYNFDRNLRLGAEMSGGGAYLSQSLARQPDVTTPVVYQS